MYLKITSKASLQLVEQGQMKQLEILQSIKQKVLQLQDATLTSNQRQSIVNSINSMKEEIVDIGSKLNINGTNLAGQKTVSISSAITKIGSDLDGDARDSFGKAISLSNDGKIMAVGAPADEEEALVLAVSKFLNTKITNGHNSVIK